MKKITIAILALVSIMSFSSFKVSADEPEQYAERWEPAVTEYIAGSTYMFDLVNDTATEYVSNDTSYAQSGSYSESGYCDDSLNRCENDYETVGSGIASSYQLYTETAHTTWQQSWPV